MITRELEAFIVTAKAKSFQKASEQLFISSTSLMKQINALEEETGLKLFKRTNRGIYLTEEGEAFYETAYNMLLNYHSGIQNAKQLQSRNVNAIHIGFSPVNPYRDCEEVLCYDPKLFSRFSFFMEEISSRYKDFFDSMYNLGTHIDLIPHFCGQLALETICNCFCLAKLPLCVAVPVNHPLARKDVLRYEDLSGQSLLTISSDANRYYQEINETVQKNVPRVKLLYTQHFDLAALNQAGVCQYLMLVGSYLQDAHPLLKLCRVEWDLTLPYGLYYAKNPSNNVLEFLEAMRDCGITGDYEDAIFVDE